MIKRSIHLVAASLLSVLCLLPAQAELQYEAEVRRTSYGIPHVKAPNFAGVGYGYGYAYANDNFCILMREVVAANGELARYFGDSGSNVNNDFLYTWLNDDAKTAARFEDLSLDARLAVRGFAAGMNRYLDETGAANLPADCQGEAWVRPIGELDMLKVFYKLILRASTGAVRDLIISAVAPPVPASSEAPKQSIDEADIRQRFDVDALQEMLDRDNLGSNMFALGSNATQSGKGMVLGNPHFPWNGPLRWYQIHLTVPGKMDVMGASLQGVPLVNIGFNDNVTWSHTVSPADRFTLYELPLAAGDPTTYVVDGENRAMVSESVDIEVLLPGEPPVIETRTHIFYTTDFGTVLDFGPLGLPLWGPGAVNAYTIADANAANTRIIEQFFRMNLSKSLPEFIDVLETFVGLPWVHTVAADPLGNAFYGDVSVVPNVSATKLTSCSPGGVGLVLANISGLIVLRGATDTCQWDIDPSSPQDGILGPDNLPTLSTTDYVTNSNDNHWLTNPSQPLEGFVPPLGTEQSARSFRTRLGLVKVEERLAGSDGLGAAGFTLSSLQDVMFSSRNYAAELIVDDLVALCNEEGPTVDIDGMGTIVDLSEACTVLGNWDKRQNTESVGPHIFLEFMESAFEVLDDPLFSGLFEVPFDVNDPVNTPRDLADTDPGDRAALMQYLGRGVKRLTDLGLAMGTPWGELLFDTRNGVDYPIHGGRDGSGIFSNIDANLSSAGYTPISYGNSYMQTVSFDENGPDAYALLSYSQSSDPASPHYADQTALYSTKTWVKLPFNEADILADPNYSTQTISEPLTGDSDGDGVDNAVDSCSFVPNAGQVDTDNDGFGNACDADFDQNGFVNYADVSIFGSYFVSDDPNGDLDGDGIVSFEDLAVLKGLFGMPPGPGFGSINR